MTRWSSERETRTPPSSCRRNRRNNCNNGNCSFTSFRHNDSPQIHKRGHQVRTRHVKRMTSSSIAAHSGFHLLLKTSQRRHANRTRLGYYHGDDTLSLSGPSAVLSLSTRDERRPSRQTPAIPHHGRRVSKCPGGQSSYTHQRDE